MKSGLGRGQSKLDTIKSSFRRMSIAGNDETTCKESVPQRVCIRRLDTEKQVHKWLIEIGFVQYIGNFARHGVYGETLYSLTSRDLRDDLGIRNLSHRKKLLKEISKLMTKLKPDTTRTFIPEFGRILDHLSNVRTFHSWERNAVQQFTFGFALLRLAPDFRSIRFASAGALLCGILGVGFLGYGTWRYMQVAHFLDNEPLKAKNWWQDDPGIFVAFAVMLASALIVITIVALDA